ncbi:MAG: ribosome maturation factor RimM [Rickettsiaceae bacterium]|nr:ribosome maturation factor RimM [Rickettsiaceae bacterium]
MDINNKIKVGKILGPWGIKGGMKIYIEKDFCEYVAKNIHKISFFLEENRKFVVDNIAQKKDNNLCIISSEFTNRTNVEKLGKQDLYCLASELENLNENEYYQSSLIGVKVINEDLLEIGRVSGIFNFGASDILEIELIKGEKIMLPFLNSIFIDIKKEYIKIKIPDFS